jgi:hypothetical protein
MRNIGIVFAALLLSACASGPSTSEQEIGVARQDMTLKVREICENYNRVIDIALQDVERKATDIGRKRTTLVWRIYTLTRCRQALVNPSPYAAFLDLWIMTLQRKQMLQDRGETLLGDLAPIVIAANQELLDYIVRIADEVLPVDARERAKAEVNAYAAAHPITGNIREWQNVGGAHGESALKAVASIVPSFGIKDTAASIADVSRSVDGVGEIVQDIPRLARWNAQLLLYDIDENPSFLSVRGSVHEISESVARFNDIVEKLPERVQAEVGKTLDEIEAKQDGIRKTLEDARGVATEAKGAVEALQVTVKEAETTIATAQKATEAFAAAGEKWQPTMEALLAITGPAPKEYVPSKGPDPNIENLVKVTENATAMAAQLNETLGQLRQVLEGKGIDQLNANAQRTVDHTTAQLGDVIDHATWRGAQLAIAIAVVAFLYRIAASRLPRR